MNAPVYVDPQERIDSHEHMRSIYRSLLDRQDRFDEFKQLLAMYPKLPEDVDSEPDEATQIRALLNERIREWTGTPFAKLSATEMRLWRTMLVEKRVNLAVSPWKEANTY